MVSSGEIFGRDFRSVPQRVAMFLLLAFVLSLNLLISRLTNHFMKAITFSLAIFLLLNVLCCGYKNATYNGETELKNKFFYDLTINGNTTLEDVTVENIATFSSAMKAQKSNFNIINSVASIECHKCVVDKLFAVSLKAVEKSVIGDAEIKKDVTLENSSINHLFFGGTEAIFINSKIKTISNTGYLSKRVIVLVDSQVDGVITFESTDECKVILKGDSKVQQVENGIIEDLTSPGQPRSRL